ncbi:MAG: DoxX family protein [Bryobacteraceae bacterium]|jgi:putative oxidoreductase
MHGLKSLYFAPPQLDIALLILRVMAGFSLFLKHGMEKLTGFSQMAAHFPDPLHIGPVPSLAFALLSDAVCSLLIILGLGTRIAALVVAINLIVAFTLVHRLNFSGPHPGELAWLYLAIAVLLVLTGAGKFSVDHGVSRRTGFLR